jgi:excisionase family DNA binding protein
MTDDTERPTYLTTAQVAARLAVSETTLMRWRERDEGPPWKRIGDRIRYDSAGLDAWLASRPHGGEGGDAA